MATLQVYTDNEDIRAMYEKSNTGSDSGFDLYLPFEMVFPPKKVIYVSFGISVKNKSNSSELSLPFWLLPRSSISKTPLRMANSVGLIDREYRGSLIAALENIGDTDYTVAKGTRLIQVAQPNLESFNIEWLEQPHGTTERGAGGFGSTGLGIEMKH